MDEHRNEQSIYTMRNDDLLCTWLNIIKYIIYKKKCVLVI